MNVLSLCVQLLSTTVVWTKISANNIRSDGALIVFVRLFSSGVPAPIRRKAKGGGDLLQQQHSVRDIGHRRSPALGAE